MTTARAGGPLGCRSDTRRRQRSCACRRLETLLTGQPTTQLTKEDIKALVASLRDITATLAQADPADKAAVYAEMGIEVTYLQDGRVLIESRPRVVNDGVGGGT